MINIVASIQIKEADLAKYIDIFKANIPLVLKENGCIEYKLTRDFPTGLPPQDLNENSVTVLEKWESQEALMAHLSAPHMATFQQQTGDMVEGLSLKVLQEI